MPFCPTHLPAKTLPFGQHPVSAPLLLGGCCPTHELLSKVNSVFKCAPHGFVFRFFKLKITGGGGPICFCFPMRNRAVKRNTQQLRFLRSLAISQRKSSAAPSAVYFPCFRQNCGFSRMPHTRTRTHTRILKERRPQAVTGEKGAEETGRCTFAPSRSADSLALQIPGHTHTLPKRASSFLPGKREGEGGALTSWEPGSLELSGKPHTLLLGARRSPAAAGHSLPPPCGGVLSPLPPACCPLSAVEAARAGGTGARTAERDQGGGRRR